MDLFESDSLLYEKQDTKQDTTHSGHFIEIGHIETRTKL